MCFGFAGVEFDDRPQVMSCLVGLALGYKKAGQIIARGRMGVRYLYGLVEFFHGPFYFSLFCQQDSLVEEPGAMVIVRHGDTLGQDPIE